jgi:hypothetical protein
LLTRGCTVRKGKYLQLNSFIYILRAAASTKALEGYCAFHRLLIAFIQRYPELNDYIIGIIDRFVATEEGRHKNVVPALGSFLPLLAVQEKYQWHQVAKAFLFEQFDRNVLWICNKFPELLQIEAAAKVNDQVRIDKSFQATTVSMRLLMFQIFFLTRVRTLLPWSSNQTN